MIIKIMIINKKIQRSLKAIIITMICYAMVKSKKKRWNSKIPN